MGDVLSARPHRAKTRTHKDLEVWKRAISLTNFVYDCTLSFPKEEMYGLAQQMRRAAVSVASNIAEGSARGSRKELLHFINIARGSLAELETQSLIAWHRQYLSEYTQNDLNEQIESESRLLTRWKQSLQNAPEPAA